MAFVFKKDGHYHIAAKFEGKWRRKTTGFTREEPAKKVLRRVENRLAEGLPPFEETPKHQGQTFRQFAKQYLEWREANGKHIDRELDALAHCMPVFGDKPLRALSRQDLDTYLTQRRQVVKPGTVQRELNVLKALLNQAVRWELIAKNPAALMTVPGANKPRERLLSQEELAALLEAAPPVLRDLIEIAALTGADLGELQSLQEKDCDFLREEVKFLRAYKTRPPRIIPMSGRVKEILWSRCQGQEERAIFPIVNVQRPFQKAVKTAGLTNVRFKDLRHCAISYLLMAGADVRSVMQIVGHKNPHVTLRIYARVTTEHMREAVQKLELYTGYETQRDGSPTKDAELPR